MEYGKPVAVLIDGAIRFGVITEIVKRTDKNGDHSEITVEYPFQVLPAYGEINAITSSLSKTVPEEHVVEWKHYSNPAAQLMDNLGLGDWARAKSEELLAPTGDTARVLAEEWGAKSSEAASMASEQIKVQEPVKHLPHHHPVPGEDAVFKEDIPF